MKIAAIETRYAGCRFRSRLEARWAVFFDRLGITWEYEPQGFTIDGRAYLPDFHLTGCDTWIEVKGDEAQLDRNLMLAAAEQLPQGLGRINAGPSLMILGPIPEPQANADWLWTGFNRAGSLLLHGTTTPMRGMYGFGLIHHPFTRNACLAPFGGPASNMPDSWLTPVAEPYDPDLLDGTLNYRPDEPHRRAPTAGRNAYTAARSARFEHGESGA